MIFISRHLVPKGYLGMAIFPFVFLKEKGSKKNIVLINHEYIHLRQQLELLIVLFYVWYGMEFLLRWLYFRNWNEAYRNISFEKEAYANEKDLDYLKSRSFWHFLNYL